MNSLNIRKSDTVVVLSGKDKGKKGKVQVTLPAKGMVVVDGVNIVTRHTKPRRQGQAGGIMKKEAPIRACKLMRVCPKCDKPTRTAHHIDAEGNKSRMCVHCREMI